MDHPVKVHPRDTTYAHDGRQSQEDESKERSTTNSGNGIVRPDPSTDEKFHRFTDNRRNWVNLSAIFTIVLAFILGGVIRYYDKQRVLTERETHVFYAVGEGLIIFLGLNNNEALKALATSFGNWNLRRRKWSRRSENLLAELGSFKGLMKVVFFHRVAWWIRLAAILWLLLALGAQALTAAITLGFSVQDGTNYNDTYTTPGVVNIPDLACFTPPYYPNIGCGANEDVAASQSIAHAYGDIDQDLHCLELNDLSEVFSSQHDEACFYLHGTNQIAFRYDEYNPEDQDEVYPRFTSRVITASSDCCRNYTQTSVVQLSGGESRYTYSNSTYTGTIVIPDYVVAQNGTTYIYRDSSPPQNATQYACGPRCIRMWAYGSLEPNSPPQFYECAVSISKVTNVTEDEHAVSDDVARLAAASIGLTGHSYQNNNNWTQFQLYPYGATWNALSHYVRHPQFPPPYLRPGDIMATNALMALSVMAKTNRRIAMGRSSRDDDDDHHDDDDRNDALVPVLGSKVLVDWWFLLEVLAGIVAGHIVAWIGCIWLDWRARTVHVLQQENEEEDHAGRNGQRGREEEMLS